MVIPFARDGRRVFAIVNQRRAFVGTNARAIA